jgi:hypothetical protein
MKKIIIYTDGGSRGNHSRSFRNNETLWTLAVPTAQSSWAYLHHGGTSVSPTPFPSPGFKFVLF